MPEPVLCFVREPWAWFTTCPLDRQWGDDWNDAPYESNAEEPYEWRSYMQESGIAPYSLVKLAYEGAFDEPCSWPTKSDYSVKAINAGTTPWLKPSPYGPHHGISIPAGTALGDFIRLVERAGGRIWVPMDMANVVVKGIRK